MGKIIRLPEVIIDSHCHGRDLGENHKTTVKQVLREAKRGNIGISVFMPNTQPPITTIENLLAYFNLIVKAEKKLGIPQQQYLYFGVSDNNPSQCQLALEYSNVVGLKIYPRKLEGGFVTTGSVGVAYDETIKKAMRLARDANKVIAVHCDDPLIIEQFGNTIDAEVSYLKKILRLAQEVPGVKIVICHVSCRQSAETILEAQRQGMLIAIELAPHYLWFDSEGTNWNHDLNPVFYHCYNNLRGSADREYLISLLGIKNPLILIGSDSACHTSEEKKLALNLGGIPSNQEMVAVVLTHALEMGLPENQIARLLSSNASKFLGIPVPLKLKEYRLEKRVDDLLYNQGKVTNPWNGSELFFTTPL